MQSEQSRLPAAQSPSARSRKTREQWIEIVEQYLWSLWAQLEFSQLNDLSLTTFKNWKHRLSMETEAGFVAIEPVELSLMTVPEYALHIRLTLGDGIALDVTKS